MPKWNFRDVSLGISIFRNFLLGRKYTLHGRFPPLLSSRTIPPINLPRTPEYKYAEQFYCHRNAMNSVKPPVTAPVAEGPPIGSDPTKKAMPGGISPDSVCFNCAPTPGPSWWWDGHCYFECVPDPPCPPCPPPCPPCPPPESCEGKQ